jgi:CheY-like chemotaxis protein
MDDIAAHAEGRCPNGKKLLVVVDDEATRMAVTLFLEGQGYAVAAAENGQEGLDHLCQNTPPSVILLDLMMPVMDGYEFKRAQRKDPTLASIPVVADSCSAEKNEGNPSVATAFGQKITAR